MSNPLMRVMLNNTINKLSINAQVHDKNDSPRNLREEQDRLLKEILAKHKSEIACNKDSHINGNGIKLITLEELQRDYQRVEPAVEKKEINKTSKNIVSLASIGKLYREV